MNAVGRPTASARWLAFELAGQRYALPLHSVSRIVRAAAVTRLPLAPDVVAGALDVALLQENGLPVRGNGRVWLRRFTGFEKLELAAATYDDVSTRVRSASVAPIIDTGTHMSSRSE